MKKYTFLGHPVYTLNSCVLLTISQKTGWFLSWKSSLFPCSRRNAINNKVAKWDNAVPREICLHFSSGCANHNILLRCAFLSFFATFWRRNVWNSGNKNGFWLSYKSKKKSRFAELNKEIVYLTFCFNNPPHFKSKWH